MKEEAASRLWRCGREGEERESRHRERSQDGAEGKEESSGRSRAETEKLKRRRDTMGCKNRIKIKNRKILPFIHLSMKFSHRPPYTPVKTRCVCGKIFFSK